MEFKGAHFISIDQLSRPDIDLVFRVAEHMEPFARRQRRTRVLGSAVLCNLFFEPSTRSRISFGAAFCRLGGATCDTTGFQFSSMAKGESIFDTSRVVSGYADVIVVRHPVEGTVREFANAARVPVINGGDGPGEHPTQALLDLYTIYKERGGSLADVDGLSIAMVGDLRHGRTVHSLTKLLSLFRGTKFTFVAPDELQMPESLVERATAGGHTVTLTNDLKTGLANADVVYITRIQQERFTEPEDAEKFRGYYSVTKRLYEEVCRPGTVLMHPLPRDSRVIANELDPDLNDHPSLAIFRQAWNGIPIRMALFALILGVEHEVGASSEDAPWRASVPAGT